MLLMLGVIRPSLAGWSMMVLREEDAGVDIGPNIHSEASPQTDPICRIDTITRRFEAKLHCCPVTVVRDITPGRGIPAGCVAPPSNIPDILGRRALPSGRRAPGFMPRSTGTGQ